MREPLRVADRVAEPGRTCLARVQDLQAGARIDQRSGIELGIGVEMVLDRALAAAGDEQHACDPGADKLLDDILHDGLVNDRQHLLGL